MTTPWFDIFDRPIAFHRVFVDLTGSVHAALMLSQAFYWSNPKRNDNPDRWFFRTQAKWEEETGLKRTEQEGARAKLRKTPFWKEERRGIPAQLYYRIDLQALENQLANKNAENLQSRMRKTCNLECGKVTNLPAENPQSIKETTEETTEEKKEISLPPVESAPHAVTLSKVSRAKKPPRGELSHFLPEDFVVTEPMRLWAQEHAPGIDIDRQTTLMRNHEFDKPHSDWNRAWRNWIIRAMDMPRNGHAAPSERLTGEALKQAVLALRAKKEVTS